MKNFIRFYFLFSLITIAFSCSDDSDSENQLEENNEYIEYINTPNSNGQLLSEIFIENDNAVTYVYGKTGNDGSAQEIESFAFNVVGTTKVDYVVLDDNQRVSFIYTEIGGVKQSEIQVFNYIEENLINFVVFERDWDTMEDTILDFTAVEIDGDNYTGVELFRNTNGIEWSTVTNWLGICVGVAGAAILVYTAPTILAGVLAAVIFAGAASANEIPVDTLNPEAPEAPEEEVDANQCEDSDLEVTIGVDPGNLLVAIVNGDSEDYDFHWSTGESDTGLISDSIVVSEDGDYYLMVIDDYGCTAFASVTISENNYEELIIGTWRANSVLYNGSEIFDPACFEELVFTMSGFTAQDLGTCDAPQSGGGDYNIAGNTLTVNFTEGNVSGSASQQIIELTETSFVVSEGNEYVYSYERVDIFGTWTITANECDGTDIDYTGSITLNTDYTVTQEDDSGGNYITNYFTFENNVLFIKTEYMDPVCGGTESRFQSDTVTLNYDGATDSFSGVGNTTKAEIDVSDCQIPAYNCNYNVALSR